MRKWLKEIVREVIKEEVKNSPLIISARAPTRDDIYAVGTVWLHGNDKYTAKKVTVQWEKE